MTLLPDPPWMTPGQSHELVMLSMGVRPARHLLRRLENAAPPGETHALDERDQALISAYCGLYVALGEDGPEGASVAGDQVIVPLPEPVILLD